MGRNKKGFTLVELMVVVSITGILMATAIPVYHTWQQRAYGSEAAIMLKQLVNAEISYYLEHDKFYDSGKPLSIYHDTMIPSNADELVFQNLNISIPQGHFINYDLYAEDELFYLVISSHGSFKLFKDAPQIYATLDKNGTVTIEYATVPD